MATIDITDAKELTLAVNNNLKPSRFLASFFKTLTHDTKDVMIDFVEGSQKLAPYIRDGQESTITNRDGYATRSVHCYDISLKRRTTAFDCLKRLPGEAPVVASAKSPEERAAELAGRDMAELQGRIRRSEEKLISDAMFTGKVSIKDAAGKEIDSVDLGLAASHKLSKAWTTANYKGITSDIEEAATKVAEDSGLTATDVILGSIAADTAFKNDFFMKQLDTKNLAGIAATVNLRVNRGARLVGVVGGLRIWRYDEIYKDASNTTQKIIPASGVVVLADQLQATLHYGVAGDIKNGFFEGQFAADTWYEDDPPVQLLRVRSAPLPIIEQIAGVATITVS